MAPEPAGWSESGNGGPALNALATAMLLMSFMMGIALSRSSRAAKIAA